MHGQDEFEKRWVAKSKPDLGLPCSEPFPSLSAVPGVYSGGERGRRAEDGVGKPSEEQEKTWSENKPTACGGSAEAQEDWRWEG